MVVPPQRDPVTGKAVRDVDVLKSAQDVKSKQYKATATQKQRYKLSLYELNDAINGNNRLVSQLIDIGFTERAIEMLFGLKYMNVKEVLQRLFPDSNLAYSGVGEVPIGDPAAVEQIMAGIIDNIVGREMNTTASAAVSGAIVAQNEEVKTIQAETKEQTEQKEKITNLKGSMKLSQAIVWHVNDTLSLSDSGITNLKGLIESGDRDLSIALITQIINYIESILTNDQITKLNEQITTIRANTLGDTTYSEIVKILMNSLLNSRQQADIRNIVRNYLDKLIKKKESSIKLSDEVEAIPGESVKKPIEDTAYTQISTALNLNEAQKNILINIIIKLRDVLNKKDEEMKDENFFNRVQAIFSSIIEAKEPTDTIEKVFNFIFETAKFIDEIAGLITNRKGSIPSTVKNILDELKLQPIKSTGINVITGESVSTTSSAEAVRIQPDDLTSTTLGFDEQEKQRSGPEQTKNLQQNTTRTPQMRFVNRTTDIIRESFSRQIQEATDQFKKKINDELADVKKKFKFRGVEEKYERDDEKVVLGDEVEMTQAAFQRMTQETVDNATSLNRLPESRLQALRRRMNEFRQRVGDFRLGRVVQARYTRNGVSTIYGLFESEEKAQADMYDSDLTDDEIASIRYKPKYGVIIAPPGGGDPLGDNTLAGTGERFSGLSPKDFLYLIIILGLLAGGSIKLSDIFKEPRPDKPAGDGPVPDKPPAPPAKKKDEDGNFIKLDHNSFWDSVGLGGVIDTYNGMVDNYNRMSKEDKIKYGEIVGRFYDKFATIVNVPTLTQLKEARARYDSIRLNYDRAMESGASFEVLNGIYFELVKSKAFIDEMTNKYLDLENKTFGLNKGKDDADVTIDDVDASISINTSLKGGKSRAVIDDNYALLSKGMTERIKRKLMNKDSNYMSGVIGENKSFINFSLIKDLDYPQGLGTDNPLQFRNKEYEIKQHTNNYSNPQPFKVPSMNKLIKSSKLNKPQLNNVIQIDNKMDDSYGFKYEGLQNPNIPPDKFIKSRLFNPEYVLEKIRENKKPVQTHNDEIRFGSYVGINDNQYFQGGNRQQKQNEELNKYPDTMNKEKDIKKNRKLPNSYSLK